MGWDHELGALLIVVAVALAAVVYVLKRRKPVTGRTIDFEFGETEQSKAFFERNPKFWPAFERVMTLTNRAFGREWRAANRMEDVVYNLGETCRRDFLEIAFLAANGHGVAAVKLLRGLYERAVTLEYIRRNPDKAERFVRYGVIQESKVIRAAIDAVGEDGVKDRLGGACQEFCVWGIT